MRNEIQSNLDALKRGGNVSMPCGDYLLDEPIAVDGPCMRLSGEAWAYNADPNGVFEAKGGAKLKMAKQGFPAILAAERMVSEGMVIERLGVQGALNGMDTRDLFHPDDPTVNAGLCFSGKRIDQGEFAKLSFCGLGSGVCACDEAELDACTFERLNTDGCCVGVYFAPRASYYTKLRSCVVADTPWYGIWVRGNGSMHNLMISDMTLVRNCGALSGDGPAAAVYFENVNHSAFMRNLIDNPGTFWYYPPDATGNDQRQPQHREAVALYVTGNGNRICDNTVLNAKTAIVIRGNGNVIMNNIISGDVIIEGSGNVIVNPVFTNPEARLIIRNAAETQLQGVQPERIVEGG